MHKHTIRQNTRTVKKNSVVFSREGTAWMCWRQFIKLFLIQKYYYDGVGRGYCEDSKHFFQYLRGVLLQLVTPRAGGVECTSAASTERWTVASGRSWQAHPLQWLGLKSCSRLLINNFQSIRLQKAATIRFPTAPARGDWGQPTPEAGRF